MNLMSTIFFHLKIQLILINWSSKSIQYTYSALVKIKLIIQRMEKGVKDESDTNFAKSYFKIGSHTLEYLMNICNLKEYYAKVKLNYSDDNLANSIKTLIRIKKMYRIIDSLASIFKLIKQKEQTGDEEIAKLIHSEVSWKLKQDPFKMWVESIKQLLPENSSLNIINSSLQAD